MQQLPYEERWERLRSSLWVSKGQEEVGNCESTDLAECRIAVSPPAELAALQRGALHETGRLL